MRTGTWWVSCLRKSFDVCTHPWSLRDASRGPKAAIGDAWTEHSAFGIAFPAMVLFAEWRYLTSGDPLFRTLARRWSKIMIALFAVGVVTGTISELRVRLAVARLHGGVRQR